MEGELHSYIVPTYFHTHYLNWGVYYLARASAQNVSGERKEKQHCFLSFSVLLCDEVFAGDWGIGNAVTVLQHQSPSSNPTLKPQQQGNQDHSESVVCVVCFGNARVCGT
jgi:hypothetical protein